MKFSTLSIITTITLLLSFFLTSAQQNINITDQFGRKQGNWEKKDSVGRLVYTGTFENNVPIGKFTYYDTLGHVKAVTEFSEGGNNAYTYMYYKGQLLSEGLYVKQQKHGVWKYYNQDSIIIAEEIYKNGTPHGTWRTYYADGSILEEITYVDGVKDGPWFQYFNDGNLKTKATYKNGLLEGLATFFHPNGRVFISGPYLHNFKDGIWMHMNDKGVAEKREVWKAGFLIEEEYYDKKLEKMMKEEK